MPSPTFELHKLGWKAFEDLIACVLRETLGQTFQVFSDGPDGGRDGAFFGSWIPSGTAETMAGRFTVQCKHTSKQGTGLTKDILNDELPKVQRLSEKGLADVYLLFTNCALSGQVAEKLEAELRQAGAKHARIFGSEWIERTIAENPSLRRLVPRLYGLGDLTQIVTHQAYRQAKEVLDSIAPDLACFVPTDAYRRCAHALREHGFVMLIGEPASGKTMIANLLALSAADEWGLQTQILSCPEDFDRKWNPDDPGQFFWVDDAFGSNHCDFDRIQEWNQRLPQLKAAIHRKARVVFTSRSYIFRAAQSRFNSHKFELLNDNRVTIEVENLSESERAMILYNHVKLGTQTQEFRRVVKGFLPTAAATPKFLPEIARRFANPQFTRKLPLSKDSVADFFSNPMTVMADIVKGLANAERAALALVFAKGGSLPIPLQVDDGQIISVIASMQSSVGDVKAALVSLDDSLLRQSNSSEGQYWQFRHPTIRDAFATDVASNPELVEIYLAGVKWERLIEEISCGDMEIEGVKLIVPSTMFNRVLGILVPNGKIDSITRPLLSFLATRCNAEFLGLFFEQDVAKEKLVGLIYGTGKFDPVLTIFGRLNMEGLLQNEMRLRVLTRLSYLAEVDHSDCFVDADFVGTLLTTEENAARLASQKDVLYSSMDDFLDEIEEACSLHDDVDDAFYDVRKLIGRFQEENEARFGEGDYNEAESAKTQKILEVIDSRIVTLKRKQAEAADYDELETEEAPVSSLPTGRSIFDDIDE